MYVSVGAIQSSCHCMCQSVFTCGSRANYVFLLHVTAECTRSHTHTCDPLCWPNSFKVGISNEPALERCAASRRQIRGQQKDVSALLENTTNCAGAPSRQALDWAQRSPNRIRGPISFAAIMVISHKTWMRLVQKPEMWKIDCMKTVAQVDDFWKNKKHKTLIYLLYLISAVGHYYVCRHQNKKRIRILRGQKMTRITYRLLPRWASSHTL